MMSRTPSKGKTPTRVVGAGIWWGFLGVLLVAAAIAVLILQNDQTTHFEWLWFDFSASFGMMLFLTALATVIVTSIGGLVWRHRRRRQLELLGRHGATPRKGAAEPNPAHARDTSDDLTRGGRTSRA
jgi:uncharacterized integral membrane protein